MEELKVASVFLAWLTKGMVVSTTVIRSLERDYILGFEHVVLEMLLRHLSINVQWEVGYMSLGHRRYTHTHIDNN